MADTLRTRLLGDKDAGDTLRSVAQQKMDNLLIQMQRGGLQQLSRTFIGDDGSTIRVSNQFGQKEIVINVPKKPEEGVEEKKKTEKNGRWLQFVLATWNADHTVKSVSYFLYDPVDDVIVKDDKFRWQVAQYDPYAELNNSLCYNDTDPVDHYPLRIYSSYESFNLKHVIVSRYEDKKNWVDPYGYIRGRLGWLYFYKPCLTAPGFGKNPEPTNYEQKWNVWGRNQVAVGPAYQCRLSEYEVDDPDNPEKKVWVIKNLEYRSDDLSQPSASAYITEKYWYGRATLDNFSNVILHAGTGCFAEAAVHLFDYPDHQYSTLYPPFVLDLTTEKFASRFVRVYPSGDYITSGVDEIQLNITDIEDVPGIGLEYTGTASYEFSAHWEHDVIYRFLQPSGFFTIVDTGSNVATVYSVTFTDVLSIVYSESQAITVDIGPDGSTSATGSVTEHTTKVELFCGEATEHLRTDQKWWSLILSDGYSVSDAAMIPIGGTDYQLSLTQNIRYTMNIHSFPVVMTEAMIRTKKDDKLWYIGLRYRDNSFKLYERVLPGNPYVYADITEKFKTAYAGAFGTTFPDNRFLCMTAYASNLTYDMKTGRVIRRSANV